MRSVQTMMMAFVLGLALFVGSAAPANAHPRVSVGIGIGYGYRYAPAYRIGYAGYHSAYAYRPHVHYAYSPYVYSSYAYRPYYSSYYYGPSINAYSLSYYPYYSGYSYVYPRYAVVAPTYVSPSYYYSSPSYYYDDYYRGLGYTPQPNPRDVVRGAVPSNDEVLRNPRPATGRANVRVFLPVANAQVSFEGVSMGAAGRDRTFQTPVIEAGRMYSYTVTATWMDNGQERTETRKVDVQAGQTSVADFAGPSTIPVPPVPKN
jgi:uncharacterized protein (TIGR03000 family)